MNEYRQRLKEDLALWTRENLISPAEAEAIWAHSSRHGGPSLTAPFLGAAVFCLLAGAALMVASLWNGLSQMERFYAALVPLLLSLLAAAFLLRQDLAGRAVPMTLREGVGIFHGLVVTASLWMVHDSFFLDGDVFGLAMAAALFLLVMLYLLRSAGLGVIFAANAAAMAWLSPFEGWPDGLAWLLMALSLPFFFLLVSGKRERGGIAFAWAWMAAVLVLTFYTASGRMWQVQFFSAAASLTWLFGAALRRYDWLGSALRFFGGAAVSGTVLAGAFGSVWQAAPGSWFLAVLLAAFLGIDGFLLYRLRKDKEWLAQAAGLIPFLIAAAGAASFWDRSGALSAVIVTFAGLILGVAILGRGIETGRTWQIAAGACLAAGEGLIRLSDSALTFGQRGFFFFAVGAAGLALSAIVWYASRRRGQAGKEDCHEDK